MEQNIIGTTVAALRREKGMTQDALAARLGVSAQAVSKWENGLSCPDILMLPEIADLFGVSVDELFGRAPAAASAPVPAQESVVYHDLPWEDDDSTLHAVLFLGHRLVGHSLFSRGSRERANVDFHYDGPAINIHSEFAVICGENTTVSGNVEAKDGVRCGDVLGHVNAGDGVQCGNVAGNVNAGDSVACGNVEGSVNAGDGVKCGNIRGRVIAGDGITCTGIGPAEN